jgi:hypothetical protein
MLRTKNKMRRSTAFLLPVSVLLLLLTTLAPFGTVRATTLQRLSLDQLAAGSDAVARVNFSSAESRWENGTIWTVTTLHVVETMKGNLPAEISVRLPGGRVGHLTATVEGTPRFHPGDDAIVFLKMSPVGGFAVAGWVQGTFRISRDPRTGDQSVTQDSSAFPVFDAATRSFRTEGVRHMPVEEFRGRVASAIARGEGQIR